MSEAFLFTVKCNRQLPIKGARKKLAFLADISRLGGSAPCRLSNVIVSDKKQE